MNLWYKVIEFIEKDFKISFEINLAEHYVSYYSYKFNINKLFEANLIMGGPIFPKTIFSPATVKELKVKQK